MRDELKFLVVIRVLFIAFAFSACQKNTAENVDVAPLSDNSTPASAPSPKSLAVKKSDSSVRKIDFKNFTYPLTKDQGGGNGETFTLKNGKQEGNENQGEATLQTIEYGDATGDGSEDAMISVYPYSGGNCQCYMVFIYALENKKPKLLWSFDTWDKAEGGFKRVYSENDELIVELFGDSRFEDGKWNFTIPEGKFKGLCCPTVYTKSRFKWNGEKFVVEGTPEMFDFDWEKQRKENSNTSQF
jgi:hypothetical protein